MTGLDPAEDRICEVAVVRVEQGRIVETFSQLVNPGRPMHPEAAEVTGLTDAELAGAPPFSSVARRMAELLDGAVVVGHRTPFDLSFLLPALEACDITLPEVLTLDTLVMAKRLFRFPRNNLQAVAKRLEVHEDGAHRALADAMTTWRVLRAMLETLDPDGEVTVAELSGLLEALAPNSPTRLRQRALLRSSLESKRTVWIEYQSGEDPLRGTVRREVAPWLLKLPRLQGYCFLRNAERVFRVDRIRTVSPGERTYEVPDTFDKKI